MCSLYSAAAVSPSRSDLESPSRTHACPHRDQLIPSAQGAALRRYRQVERLCREIYRDDSGNVGGREPISGNEGARGQASIEISVEISYSHAPTLNECGNLFVGMRAGDRALLEARRAVAYGLHDWREA